MLRSKWSCSPKTITRPVGRPRRRRAERARGGALRRPGDRRGALAIRGREPSSASTGCATTTPSSGGSDRGPPVAARAADDARGRGLRRLPEHAARVTILREHGRRPVGRRLRRPRAARRAASSARSTDHVLAVSDAVDRVRGRRGATCTWRATRRAGCSATRPPRTGASDGAELADHVRQPGRHRGSRCRSGFPSSSPPAPPGCSQTACSAAWALPAWASRTGFRLLDPVKSMRNRIEFILQLHDREALLPRERQRRFLEADGWVAWPGPAMADFLRQFIAHNRMLEGGFVIDDRLVTLADIECPILSVVGTVDQIAPAAGVRAIRQAAPRAEVYELAAPRAGTSGWSSARPRTTSRGRRWPRGRAGAPATASCRGDHADRATTGTLELAPAGPQPRRLRRRARRRGRGGDGAVAARHARRTARRSVRELTPRGRRPAAAARAARADPAGHADLARAAGRGARPPSARRHRSSCSRIGPTPRTTSTSGSTTSSAG